MLLRLCWSVSAWCCRLAMHEVCATGYRRTGVGLIDTRQPGRGARYSYAELEHDLLYVETQQHYGAHQRRCHSYYQQCRSLLHQIGTGAA